MEDEEKEVISGVIPACAKAWDNSFCVGLGVPREG
jgi:hypothetical protein